MGRGCECEGDVHEREGGGRAGAGHSKGSSMGFKGKEEAREVMGQGRRGGRCNAILPLQQQLHPSGFGCKACLSPFKRLALASTWSSCPGHHPLLLPPLHTQPSSLNQPYVILILAALLFLNSVLPVLPQQPTLSSFWLYSFPLALCLSCSGSCSPFFSNFSYVEPSFFFICSSQYRRLTSTEEGSDKSTTTTTTAVVT